jgi:hypothetical protein
LLGYKKKLQKKSYTAREKTMFKWNNSALINEEHSIQF